MYSIKQLAGFASVSVSTMTRYIGQITKEGKFKKTSIGGLINERDAKVISSLIGFTIPYDANNSQNTSQPPS